jgi:hypothetical protein
MFFLLNYYKICLKYATKKKKKKKKRKKNKKKGTTERKQTTLTRGEWFTEVLLRACSKAVHKSTVFVLLMARN